MKKVINGKMYNTETAKCIAVYDNFKGNRDDINYFCKCLYLKKTGEYFIYEQDTAWHDREETITPCTLESAKKWVEKYCDGDEYEKIFGEVEE